MSASPTLLIVPISEVHVPADRIRPAYRHRVEAIADSYVKSGIQQQPVILRQRVGGGFWLVDGLHRLEAMRLAGGDTVRGEVHELSEDEARLVEVEANINREDLSALDSVLFHAARKAAYEAIYPELKKGGDRKSLKYWNKIKRASGAFDRVAFSEEAARKAGLSPQHIRKMCAIAGKLTPDMIEGLRRVPVADNLAQLKALAELKDDERMPCAMALAEGKASSVAEARIEAGFAPRGDASPDEIAKKNFRGALARLPRHLRKWALEEAEKVLGAS
jgi:ParB family transcriptional regulator, chromosome partitioning protein